MSYDRPNRGGRRRYRDDYDDRRREIVESPQERLRNIIIKLGEVDPVQEIATVERHIRELVPPVIAGLSESFHIAVTEQPYKIPFYAALLRLLHNPSSTEESSDVPEELSLGKQILEEFWKGFQAYVDKLMWRETRLCIHFFAHLVSAQLISAESFVALLQSFTAVLDEFGVSHGRAKRAALCAAEGVMIAGATLISVAPSVSSEITTSIQTYTEGTNSGKWIVQPTAQLHSSSVSAENADEASPILDTALAALNALESSGFEGPYPRPYSDYPPLDMSSFTPFNLPSLLVPPEVIELDGLSTEAEESDMKKEEWPEFFFRLFPDDVTPDPNTPAGYAVRTDILAIIDVFEVNRKECARLLLEYPKWTVPGTFKPKPGAPSPEAENLVNYGWQLESTLLETILGASFLLPESSQLQIYYDSLITEVSKLTPSTVGPAVGKSIRKLYASLSDGLDVEIERRFSEWFAVHMSNFNFQWVWKEWIPDLQLAVQHPKRAFMRRALAYETRLSYYERIVKSLPEAMHPADAHTLPPQAPGPDFMYDDPTKPHHDAAQSILNLFRGRAKAEDVIAHLDTLRNTLEIEIADSGQPENADSLVRIITTQSLLHIGSRSFSHLLNAIERYLPLLRTLATGAGTVNSEAKADILTASASFWKHNSQMVAIVFDKLMQYQIVDPTDVVSWTFLHVEEVDKSEAELKAPLSLSTFEWDLLKGALNKAIGRVNIARRKLALLRKEEDEDRARVKARGENMDVDGEPKLEEPVPEPENPALTVALKAFSSLTREQKAALSRTLEGFVSCLAPSLTSAHPNPKAKEILTEHSWHNRANWGKEEWNAWETWGWYRHFCRAYSPYLRNYAATFTAVSFARFEGQSDPASDLLQKIWNVSIGQE